MSALHEAVARAAAYADWQAPPEITIPVGARHDRIAAAAIRVVLAEAQCAIEALDWHIPGEGPPEDEPLLIDRSDALAVLAALSRDDA